MARKKNTRNASGTGTIRKKTITRKGAEYTYWEARYCAGTDSGTGKLIRKTITGKTQKEVSQKLKDALKAVDSGQYMEPTKLTVSKWLEEWMTTYCERSVKPLTVSSYKGDIERYIKPSIGAIKLKDLKSADVQKVWNEMLNKGLSAKTVKTTAAVLHKALEVAIDQRLILFNPCDRTQLPKVERPRIKPFQDDEIPKFLAKIKDNPFENAFALCLLAGLREGECLGLSWDNVDFKNGKITICQQLQVERKAGGKYYIANTTKSGKSRTIKPPSKAFDYLKAEKVKQLENRLHAGSAWNNENNLVFTNAVGENLIIVTFYKNFKAIAASIGRPDARPHDLRHTAATVAIANGADIKSVQDMLGHATASFTLDVYAHTSEKMMDDTAARVQSYYDSLNKQAIG